jgi:protein-disulfide isomerase
MKNTLILAGSIIIAGVFIGGGIYLSKIPAGAKYAGANQPSALKEIAVKKVQADDHILGPKDAKVTIIEYSDPECPFCKRFHNTMISLMADKNLEGKIAWVYRHFPLDSLHKKARYESEALECAGIVGGNEGFWKLTNKVYEVTTSNDGLDTSTLPALAESVGLPKDKFTACLTNGDAKAVVESSYQEAIKAGGGGTPYSILIGPKGQQIPISGAIPIEALKVQIESLL